jgi:hypothetical protein
LEQSLHTFNMVPSIRTVFSLSVSFPHNSQGIGVPPRI